MLALNQMSRLVTGCSVGRGGQYLLCHDTVFRLQVADNGGKVLGIIPAALIPREVSGGSVGEVVIVKDMHERKARMAAEADAFIALPGQGPVHTDSFKLKASVCMAPSAQTRRSSWVFLLGAAPLLL